MDSAKLALAIPAHRLGRGGGRPFLLQVFSAAVIVSVLLVGLTSDADGALPRSKPNVLFIAIDDLNDWAGCLGGHPQAQTPNMDRLASRGTLFRNAHCQSPLCNPSRCSLLTGLRPTTTGIYGLAPGIRDVARTRKCVTLPQYFARHGYFTASFGKVFHDGSNREGVPEFAWYLHWKVPEPRFSWLKKAQQWRSLVRAYLASTTFMDSQIGRVLDALDATGRRDNTVIVLWSDNAYQPCGERGLVLGCTNKRYTSCRVRARGLQEVCRPRALTRRSAITH
jgi:arylsulfatase A-like enzyme